MGINYKRRITAARSKPAVQLAPKGFYRYSIGMNWLTKSEQLVLGIVLGLLLTGLFVKHYRTAHPAAAIVQPEKR
jgi:hypothetical protein